MGRGEKKIREKSDGPASAYYGGHSCPLHLFYRGFIKNEWRKPDVVTEGNVDMVQEGGLEPPPSFEDWLLRPARLPIPPPLQKKEDGRLPGTRTPNLQIKSLLLYRLS